jgi:hypothetical protein
MQLLQWQLQCLFTCSRQVSSQALGTCHLEQQLLVAWA